MDRAGLGGNSAQQARLDRLLAPYRHVGAPGVALAVFDNGEPVLVRTHGSADLARGTPVEPETNFRLASITKQFTAACILILAERGALVLDAGLPELSAGFAGILRAVTVRHLLRHSSGLVDYESLIAPGFAGQVSDRDVLRLVRDSGHTYFESGTQFRYSNTGYALLAVLVEELTGTRFPAFLHDNIFTPLGMDGTVAFEDNLSPVDHRALGYTVGDDGTAVLSDQDATSAVLGDGGIYSSLRDFGKWDQALYTDTLLSHASMASMWTPGLGGYGSGWRIDRFDGHRRLHHEGFSCGFQNHVMRFPEQHMSILVLTNRREPAVKSMSEAIARLFLPDS